MAKNNCNDSKNKIRIGIVGYGKLGKACEKIALCDENIELVGIFSRRNGIVSPFDTKIYNQNDLFEQSRQDNICKEENKFNGELDVAVLCVGSQGDLEETAAKIAKRFNTVDCFDNHARMSIHMDRMSKIAEKYGRLCYVGTGWDPGIFSLLRACFACALKNSKIFTFWGKGVSQGHSEAIRKIDGVLMAKQYTIPKENAMRIARATGEELLERDKHLRECYVVAKEGADKENAMRLARATEEELSERDKHLRESFVAAKEGLDKENAMRIARATGEELLERDKHLRECFVVAKEGADKGKIENEIKNMPNYFAGYDTIVHFVDEKYFNEHCKGMEHGGVVIAKGSFDGYDSSCEASLKMQDNPIFTAGIMITYAKANARAYKRGDRGVKSVLDIAMSDLLDGEWIDKIKRFV